MALLIATLLAVLQGATEFLPVSSSGHLALAQIFIPGIETDIAFDVLLHVGTVLAVLVYFRAEILQLLRGAVRPGSGDGNEGGIPFAGVERRTILLLLLATAVTGALGLLLQDFAERAFDRPLAVAAALLVTAFVLALCVRVPGSGLGISGFAWWKVLLVGAAQGITVFPGLSRSGTTIAVCLLLGMDRRIAAHFSLLLSVPAILGAFVLKAGDLSGSTYGAGAMLWGLVLTAAVGYGCIHLLVGSVRRGWFHRFAWYCALLALAVAVAALAAGR